MTENSLISKHCNFTPTIVADMNIGKLLTSDSTVSRSVGAGVSLHLLKNNLAIRTHHITADKSQQDEVFAL